MLRLLGLQYLHQLTTARTYELRVDLEDFENQARFAKYSNFTIASEADNYRLGLGIYRAGNAGRSFRVFCTQNNDSVQCVASKD